MFRNPLEPGNIVPVFKPCSKQARAQRCAENARAGRRLWQWCGADLALPGLTTFSLLHAECLREGVWRSTSSGVMTPPSLPHSPSVPIGTVSHPYGREAASFQIRAQNIFEILERGLFQPGTGTIPAVKPKQ